MGICVFKPFSFRLILILSILLLGQGAFAASQTVDTEQGKVTLAAGNYHQEADGMKILNTGLFFQLKKDWKVYWRNPGDVGLPIGFDWTGSENVKSTKILWPAPKRYIDLGNIESIGYKDEVLVPVMVTPEDPAKPMILKLKTSYAVCSDICILAEASFNLVIDPAHEDINQESLIEKYLAKVPAADGSNGISIAQAKYQKDAEGKDELAVSASTAIGFQNPELFVEGPQDFRFPRPEPKLSDDHKTVEFHQSIEQLVSSKKFMGGNLVLTLVDGENSIEKNFPVLSKQFDSEIFGITITKKFVLVAIFAFIGGLILNVMPCVLPVLSIKMLGIISHSHSSNKRVAFSFLATVVGILLSFQLLALTVIFLKMSGMEVGWGFNFQQPIFIISLILIINFFAANLWGIFEINLPSWLADALHRRAHKDESSLFGHFLSGALATILATPCTAPFLGTAVGFALSQGSREIIWTFFFMGLGLSMPYLIFAAFPKLVKKLLPKPGKWMVSIKHFMGNLLILTSFWLVWVLAGQIGQIPALLAFIVSFSMFAIFWVIERINTEDKNKIKIALFVILTALTFYLPLATQDSFQTYVAKNEKETWQEFDPAKIQELVSRGKVVFVDITADWCLTCKANYLFVLSRADVSKEIFGPDIVTMRADWTSKNNKITEYLESHNRYGIPFNAVYGPGAPEGIVLPEVLTKTDLFKALYKAKGSNSTSQTQTGN